MAKPLWKRWNNNSPKAAATLQVKIQTPEGIIWEGSATAVSSKNSAGPFDLLPQHANIITMIEQEPIVIHTATEKKELRFKKAIISCQANNVSIYADIIPGTEDLTNRKDKTGQK